MTAVKQSNHWAWRNWAFKGFCDLKSSTTSNFKVSTLSIRRDLPISQSRTAVSKFNCWEIANKCQLNRLLYNKYIHVVGGHCGSHRVCCGHSYHTSNGHRRRYSFMRFREPHRYCTVDWSICPSDQLQRGLSYKALLRSFGQWNIILLVGELLWI